MSTSRSAARPMSLKSRRTIVAISRTRRFDRQWPRQIMTHSSHPRRRNLLTPFRKQPSFTNTRLGVTTEEQSVEVSVFLLRIKNALASRTQTERCSPLVVISTLVRISATQSIAVDWISPGTVYHG